MDGREGLRWWIAAEDRWHNPESELNVRQRCVEGAPVVETRVRIPHGDAIQRVYAVADGGGITVVEIENDSPAAMAVAFSHGALLTARPPVAMPIEGISLPAGAVVFPVGHRATIRVGLAHRGGAGALPAGLPGPLAVARGWGQQVDHASRLVLPDSALVERVVAERCRVALTGPVDDASDAAGALLGMAELVRLGADAAVWVVEAITVAERLSRSARTCGLAWDGAMALAATERLLAAAHETRATADVAAIRQRLGADGAPPPLSPPEGIRVVAWAESRLARPLGDGTCVLLPDGHPTSWLGANWEAHHVPAGPRSRVSYAVRWHGSRPALLWEVEGEPVALSGGAAAPAWHTTDARGDTLWPEP